MQHYYGRATIFEYRQTNSGCIGIVSLRVANLERQFGILREQLYGERINQVDMQLADIRGGRSQEYLGPLQELNENLRTRTEVASVLRTLQTQNIQHKFDSEELAAVQHYEVRCARSIAHWPAGI